MLSDMSAKYSPTSFDLFVFFGLLTSLSVVALLEEALALEWPNGTKGVLGGVRVTSSTPPATLSVPLSR